MARSGKLVILAILVLGVAAGAFAVWYRQQQSRHSLQFWGTEGASLIARAPHVEALWLELAGQQAADCDETVEVPGGTACVRQRQDVERAAGISNLRHALVQDATFQWSAEPPDGADWEFALRFFDEGQSSVLLFDLARGACAEARTSRSVVLDPAASKDLSDFFAEQFGGK
jgi:hypothetical protein